MDTSRSGAEGWRRGQDSGGHFKNTDQIFVLSNLPLVRNFSQERKAESGLLALVDLGLRHLLMLLSSYR